MMTYYFVVNARGESNPPRPIPHAQLPGYIRELLPKRKERLLEAGEQALKEYMDAVAQEMGKRTGTPYAPGAQPAGLQRRSGRAHEALTTYKTKEIAGGAEAKFTVPGYLKAHEYGAIIRARHAKYLAIPLPAALNADGTPKHFRARAWDRTFIIKSRRGNLLVVRRTGRGRYENLYLLRKTTIIPAELGMRRTMYRLTSVFKARLLKLIAAERLHQ